MNELCFNLYTKGLSVTNAEALIDQFIDFAVEHKVSISGNMSVGWCFCTEQELPPNLKERFIAYLKREHANVFSAIEFVCFDQDLDDFKPLDKVVLG